MEIAWSDPLIPCRASATFQSIPAGRPANSRRCPAGDSIRRVTVDTHSTLGPNLAVCRALLT